MSFWPPRPWPARSSSPASFARRQRTTQQAFEQAGMAKAPDVQANALLTNAASRGYAGLCEDNEKSVQRALDLDKSRQTQSFAVLTAGICGNGKLVASMAQELARKFPEDTMIQRVFVPVAKAFVALSAGQPQEAINDADPAKSFALVYPSAYVQGLAYLQLHEASQAANAFRLATQSPGGNLQTSAPFYAPGAIGVGAGLRHGRR